MQDDQTRNKLMNPCPNCGTDNLVGAMVCRSCGMMLGDVVPGATYKLDSPQAEQIDTPPASDAHLRTAKFPVGASITIKLREVDSPMIFPIDEEALVVGRRDPNTGYTPDVDFYRYAGYLLGVSRKHARLFRQDESLILEDLGSHNGTFINGGRLSPREQRPIRDGDTVSLGDLQFNIFFTTK